jgi:hypothetical protein
LKTIDPKSPLAGKSIVNVFGVPLFTSDTADDDIPDVLSAPTEKSSEADSAKGQSGGFFSSIVDTLNPFKR